MSIFPQECATVKASSGHRACVYHCLTRDFSTLHCMSCTHTNAGKSGQVLDHANRTTASEARGTHVLPIADDAAAAKGTLLRLKLIALR